MDRVVDAPLERWLAALELPGVLARIETELRERMLSRSILFGDAPLPTFASPFLVCGPELDAWKAQSEHLVANIERVAHEALDDRALYDRLGLQPQARPLLEIDPGYRQITVLSRPDTITRGDQLTFLEFNCDSPAMMSFSDELSAALLELEPYAAFRGRSPAEREMTRTLLDTLLTCYREYGGQSTAPTIAITDWAGQKTRYEHRRIAARFEELGYPTVVCDPREFRRAGKALEVAGRTIEIVYRRALFGEILDRQSEVEALLGAYRDGTICMVNSLRSYVASSKTLLAVLCEQGSDHRIAPTRILTKRRIAELLASPTKTSVVKRGESHGGMHVLLPGVTSDEQWKRGLEAAAGEPWPWIEQELCVIPHVEVVALVDGVATRVPKFVNWNPFMFGGSYAGGIARVSDTPLINISLGGGLLPTWRLDVLSAS